MLICVCSVSSFCSSIDFVKHMTAEFLERNPVSWYDSRQFGYLMVTFTDGFASFAGFKNEIFRYINHFF